MEENQELFHFGKKNITVGKSKESTISFTKEGKDLGTNEVRIGSKAANKGIKLGPKSMKNKPIFVGTTMVVIGGRKESNLSGLGSFGASSNTGLGKIQPSKKNDTRVLDPLKHTLAVVKEY